MPPWGSGRQSTRSRRLGRNAGNRRNGGRGPSRAANLPGFREGGRARSGAVAARNGPPLRTPPTAPAFASSTLPSGRQTLREPGQRRAQAEPTPAELGRKPTTSHGSNAFRPAPPAQVGRATASVFGSADAAVRRLPHLQPGHLRRHPLLAGRAERSARSPCDVRRRPPPHLVRRRAAIRAGNEVGSLAAPRDKIVRPLALPIAGT